MAEFTWYILKLVYLYLTQLSWEHSIQNRNWKSWSHLCRLNHLDPFLDGARLASALTNAANDITLEDLAALTDLFYIGGSERTERCLGEALVIVRIRS